MAAIANRAAATVNGGTSVDGDLAGDHRPAEEERRGGEHREPDRASRGFR